MGVIPPIDDCCGPKTAEMVKMIGKTLRIILGESLAVDPIAILTVLIPIISFLFGANCYVKPDHNLDWEEPTIIYSLLVGKKGTKKSPILKTLIAPLNVISKLVEGSGADLIFFDGTQEGLTTQLSRNKGEMLQVCYVY